MYSYLPLFHIRLKSINKTCPSIGISCIVVDINNCCLFCGCDYSSDRQFNVPMLTTLLNNLAFRVMYPNASVQSERAIPT